MDCTRLNLEMGEKEGSKKLDKGTPSRMTKLMSTVREALVKRKESGKTPPVTVDSDEHHGIVVNVSIGLLREKCKKAPIVPNLSDHQLEIFYAAGGKNVEAAFEGVMEYFTQKKESRYIFENRDPFAPDIQHAWDVLKVSFLPNLTPEGNRILLCGLWDHDPLNMDVLACIRMFLMAIDVGLFLEDVYQGYVLLLDTDGLSIRHFPWGSLPDYRRFMKFLQYGMPVYVRQIHVLRNSKMIERVYTCLKPFVKKELSEILFFHSGDEFEIFHQMVPPDCLPSELGGTIPSLRPIQDELRRKVELTIVALSKELDAVM